MLFSLLQSLSGSQRNDNNGHPNGLNPKSTEEIKEQLLAVFVLGKKKVSQLYGKSQLDVESFSVKFKRLIRFISLEARSLTNCVLSPFPSPPQKKALNFWTADCHLQINCFEKFS